MQSAIDIRTVNEISEEEKLSELIKKARSSGNEMIRENPTLVHSNLNEKATEDAIFKRSQHLVDEDLRDDKFRELSKNLKRITESQKNKASGSQSSQPLSPADQEIVKKSRAILFFRKQLRLQLGLQIKTIRSQKSGNPEDIKKALFELGAFTDDDLITAQQSLQFKSESVGAKGTRPNAEMSSSTSRASAALPLRVPQPSAAQAQAQAQAPGLLFMGDYFEALSEPLHTTGSTKDTDLSFMEQYFNLIPETTQIANAVQTTSTPTSTSKGKAPAVEANVLHINDTDTASFINQDLEQLGALIWDQIMSGTMAQTQEGGEQQSSPLSSSPQTLKRKESDARSESGPGSGPGPGSPSKQPRRK